MRIHAKTYLCGGDSKPDEMKERLLAANPGAVVQAMNSGAAENLWFVEMLAAQTLRAEKSGRLLAKKPEIDLLLRFAGTTQISRAIRSHGARPGEPFLLVAASTSPLKGIGGVADGPPRRPLSREELARVEEAALLDAARA